MPPSVYILSALVTMLVVTFALRALPFAAIRMFREHPVIEYLGRYMPVGIMLILVVYTVRNVSIVSAPYGFPELVALGSTIVVHVVKRHAVLSVVVGTVVYVGLRATVFA